MIFPKITIQSTVIPIALPLGFNSQLRPLSFIISRAQLQLFKHFQVQPQCCHG